MPELSAGAIAGITVAAVVVFAAVIIAITLIFFRKKSRVLKPNDFRDRPVSGISGLGLSRSSKVPQLGKYMTPRWYKARGEISRPESARTDVWTSRNVGKFHAEPLIPPPGVSGRYKPIPFPESSFRTSVVSNVSNDVGNFSVFPTKGIVFVPKRGEPANRDPRISVTSDGTYRVSMLSDTGPQTERRSYRNSKMQTFRF